ncbi:MAG: hypothetical protein H7196_04295, partial [candidate division SR1 bacterium]|nr:hypothetical protein [candidate division SR1 bacterium]
MKFSKVLQVGIAIAGLFSFSLPAFALRYKHNDASKYNNTDTFVAFNEASGDAGIYISAWQNFDAVADGSGYRLKIRGTNNC